MDEDTGMVHPGRRPSWWAQPQHLVLAIACSFVVLITLLFLIGTAMDTRGPEDRAASDMPTSAATADPDGATSDPAADPSSMTSPSTSTADTRPASSSTVSTPTSRSAISPSTTTTTSPAATSSSTAATSSAATTTAVSTSPTTTKPPSTSPTAKPATLTGPALTQRAFTARAGSTLRVAFTVTNTGGAGSGPRTVTVSAPPGVTIADVGIALSPARAGLRGPAAGLVPSAPPAARAISASINCLGTTCTYTVPPRMRITVTLTLDVSATAASGVLQLSAAGYAPSRATLTVQGAVVSSAGPATSTSAPAPPVTDPADATPVTSTADDAPDGADATG